MRSDVYTIFSNEYFDKTGELDGKSGLGASNKYYANWNVFMLCDIVSVHYDFRKTTARSVPYGYDRQVGRMAYENDV